MMSHPRVGLVKRQNPTDFTRPRSKSHIDNIFISKSFAPKTTAQLFYLQIPEHMRAPSDHILV